MVFRRADPIFSMQESPISRSALFTGVAGIDHGAGFQRRQIPFRASMLAVMSLTMVSLSLSSWAGRDGSMEDSLQGIVQQYPDTAANWINLAAFEVKTDQEDLAKGYFDEAIRLSKNATDVIVRIGLMWLDAGKVETSLPYLIPNLSHLDAKSFSLLEKSLEAQKHYQAAILVLRRHAEHDKTFSPEVRRAAELAFHLDRFDDCRKILTPYAGTLDSAGARWLLLSGFYLGKALNADAIQSAAARSTAPEVKVLAALDQSMLGNFKAAHDWLDAAGAAATPQTHSFVEAEAAAAGDQVDPANRQFQNAMTSSWPEFRLVATAELYKHYSVTGNSFKSNQLWDDIKEQDTTAGYKEFLAGQLNVRGYEKQANYLYRSLYRSHPGDPKVLLAVWDEVSDDDTDGLGAHIDAVLAGDPLSCDASLVAMRYYKLKNDDREIVHHGRNVALFCFDVVDPYFDLATALLNLSKPEEARVYFAKYIKSGGDKTRVPTYMR